MYEGPQVCTQAEWRVLTGRYGKEADPDKTKQRTVSGAKPGIHKRNKRITVSRKGPFPKSFLHQLRLDYILP
ncbi:hypothetical protein K435DRAFT_773679 [Dendrothele bispora CBS 962.96]|uniref:Uncharacterized protein n=1 Tax=Dendrothele bispora (strain CBS 962.96) TaxID=1314807 RepID=A0A4S8MSW2_DENBC|nr:hypothetical protein K435DRAFT_773679 [Dendrothele bispora CBS 962.96]